MMLGEFIQLDLALGEIGSFGSLRKELRFIERYYGENDLMVQINDTKSRIRILTYSDYIFVNWKGKEESYLCNLSKMKVIVYQSAPCLC